MSGSCLVVWSASESSAPVAVGQRRMAAAIGTWFWQSLCVPLTLLHKSESPPKSRAVTGSTIAEVKQRSSGCLFRRKLLGEGFYTQHVWRPSLLFEESLPSHGDGQDFQDSTCV